MFEAGGLIFLSAMTAGFTLWLHRRVHGRLCARILSDYSSILVLDESDKRSLYFEREGGDRALESAMDRDDPVRLVLPYSRVMLVSHLFVPHAKRVLIVGLGGGSLLKFYARRMPWIETEVVEIDAGVLQVARKYFDLSRAESKSVVIADALEFLEGETNGYDVIHVDAYLKSSRETDAMGIPLHLKTPRWHNAIQGRLAPGGVVAFNLNHTHHIDEDIQELRRSFPRLLEFSVPYRRQIMALAGDAGLKASMSQLVERAEKLDAMVGSEPLFQGLPGLMRKGSNG